VRKEIIKMKMYKSKQILVVFLLLSISLNLFATKFSGYFITFDNDTVYTTFRIGITTKPDLYSTTWGTYYSDENGKKQFLSPKDAKEIYFKSDRGNFRLISILNTAGFVSPFKLSGKRFFAEVHIMGKLSLCSVYLTRRIYSMTQTLIWVKENKNEIYIITLGSGVKNKIELKDFFNNCSEEILLEIDEKKLSFNDCKKATEIYNQNCSK
jgi:hypothetical protein